MIVPIAICGFAFSLPGASSLDRLAKVLLGGATTYGVFPPGRIDPAMYLDRGAPVGAPKVCTALGGVIDEPTPDASDGPALAHRFVRDAVRRAVESAGLAPGALRGQPVPVFVAHARGGAHGLYDAAVLAAAAQLRPYLAHGAHPDEFTRDELSAVVEEVGRALRASFGARSASALSDWGIHRIAGEAAEAIGTTAKALIVDGNCTGGLIALELAAREVARGAPYAVAGALSYVDVVNQVLYSNARLLSTEGCFPFAEKGNGTVISDAVVMLLVTSVERARHERLPIAGVVRGVGGANDGAAERYMLTPNPRGHALAIQRARERARAPASEIGVLVSHGTGTKLGDTVEARVFDTSLSADGGEGGPRARVPVVAIKGRVGHAKEASGLANLVALLAMFKAGAIPGPADGDEPRKALAPLDAVEFAAAARSWPVGEPRVGGVTAIASGGQSYHAIVEDAPSPARVERLLADRGAVAHGRETPVAIVGLAGAFAGAPDVATLWKNLLAGARPFERLPKLREAARGGGEGVYCDYGAPLALDHRRFVERPERYSERPADIVRFDPLHFLLVDLARQAAAGLRLAPGGNVSVVVSAEHCSEFGLRQVAATRLPEIEVELERALRATGKDAREVRRTARAALGRMASELPDLWAGSLFNLSPSFLAVRVARAFDLTGPTCAVEAGGGATSIAGLEVACGQLAGGQVEAAVWACADARLGITRYVDECARRYLSRRPVPTALDADSDGYLPGEGATVFVLRRLDDALARGERVYGVIRAIGGAFARPGGDLVDEAAMGSAIRRAYERSGVDPGELAFVEAFGTGHRPSDVAELAAVEQALGARRATSLPVGSVMPSVGHTGAAAGGASLLKAVAALSTKVLPPTLGAAKPPGARGPLRVVGEPEPLGDARFAGVNAAGPGGNHFHVVLEAGPHPLDLGR
ncbi:MAG: polyketide synthase [Polyangiaceae bacterium]|jgi:acyl transferase domain-containing protein|nr:polyketide synthase [Polyangiaceae bacterium]